ncbi:MAG: protein kinase [Candidatus Melainabacteria bacterium]|nr:protein kinase [Candidatus Melainabacteria bacterium]
MPPEKCAKCLKPKSAQAGSLTQWIIICSCDKVSSVRSEVEDAVRCKTCGKPAREQRSGSLTQWIFQRDSCNCDRPDLEFGAAPMPVDFEEHTDSGGIELDEIETETGKFPLERYGPLKILGSGSSGTVYLSHDRLLQKEVAVKVLRSIDREALLAFQNEAKTTSKLTHPHIVKVLDFGSTDGGVPFMVMELVAGKSLESVINENESVDLDRSIRIFMQLSKALAYAHGIGVLHRDLKPGNILIVESEIAFDAFLIDFGVAKLQTYYQSATVYNGTALVGTPAYMSPDQASGLEFDVRSDIYSFGCVMFETVTGRLAFESDNPMELIAMHAQKAAPLILDYINETPVTTALSRVIATCLAKDPAQRFQSADDLKRALYEIPVEPKKKAGGYGEPTRQTQLLDSESSQDKPQGALGLSAFAAVIVLLLFSLSVPLAFYFFAYTNTASDAPDTNSAKPRELLPIALGTPAPSETGRTRPSKPMRNITHITLHNETDAGLANLVHDFPNLENINILESNISPEGLRHLSKVPISMIKLENMNLTRQHLYELSKLKSVTLVNFGVQRKIDMDGIAELKRSNINYLRFSFVELTTKNLKDIAQIKKLQTLTFINCTGLAKIDIAPLSKATDLFALDLSNSDATDATLKPISRTSVRVLILNLTRVTKNVFPTLSKSKSLVQIHVTSTPEINKTLVKKFETETDKRVVLNSSSKFDRDDAKMFEE